MYKRWIGSLLLASALAPSALAQSACDLAFYPMKAGWEWQYRITTKGEAKPETMTIRRSKITDNSFTEVLQRNGRSFESSVRCTTLGLTRIGIDPFTTVAEDDAPGGAAPTMTMNAKRLEGTQISAEENWEVGQTWNSSVEIEGSARVGILNASIGGGSSGAYRVVAYERVTVPGGTFEAVKVTGALKNELKMSAGPINRTLGGSVSATFWFVDGVGLVKVVAGNVTYELSALKK